MTIRVRVYGVRGYPPPPTTKLAIFYPGGYESQILLNATGYGTDAKWELIERQFRHFLPSDVLKALDTFEFQRSAPSRCYVTKSYLTMDFRIGTPASDPLSQRSSTTYLRIVVASVSAEAVLAVAKTMKDIALKHFSGR